MDVIDIDAWRNRHKAAARRRSAPTPFVLEAYGFGIAALRLHNHDPKNAASTVRQMAEWLAEIIESRQFRERD